MKVHIRGGSLAEKGYFIVEVNIGAENSHPHYTLTQGADDRECTDASISQPPEDLPRLFVSNRD